jgi:hypothetical protein
MPVLTLLCPSCGHAFRGSVLAGTKAPDVWICSQCRAAASVVAEEPHPWEANHAAACRCCG